MNLLQGVTNQNYYYQQGNRVASNNNSGQLTSPSMLNTGAVYTAWKNPNSSPVKPGDAALTMIHLNDNHRKTRGIAKFKTAIQEITKKVQNSANGLLSVHSGDYNVGTDPKKLKLQVEMLNDLGVQYAALGNHEFDINPQNLAKELVNARYVSLAANLILPEGCGLDKLVQSGKIAKSTIHETKGQKYGLIGLSPPDLLKRLDPNSPMYGVNVLPKEQAVKVVQEEVNKLRAQGINKIILVSHVGLALDKEIAQSVDGVDIILGGHSHDLLDPLEPGVSLVNSTSNEPVLIFQNGKNAKFLGVTDTYFDEKGIVKAAIARQEDAKSFESNNDSEGLVDRILGKSPVIGVSAGKYTSSGVKMKENAIADFVADSIRTQMGADIALFQSFAVRDSIEQGNITERDVDEVLPFIDGVHLLQIKGQDVIDALTQGSQTYMRKNRRPGILQVSGAKYTISPDGNATNVQILNKNGQYEPIDPNREYKVAYDQYLIKGCEGFKSLAKPMNVLKATYDTNADLVKKTIKQMNFTPLQLKTEGRVTVQAQDPMASGKMPKALQKAESVTATVPAAVNQVAQPQLQQNTQQVQQLPKLDPRVAYRMPVYPSVPPQYYYAQPQVMPYYPYPPVMQQPVMPQGYYYGYNPARPTSAVR